MKKITLFVLALVAGVLVQAGNLHALKADRSGIVATADGEAVTPPEGLTPALYTFKGFDTYIKANKETECFVIFADDEVYIQGLSVDYLPDGWVKGTLAGGTVTIPSCFMGTFDFWGDSYELYFDGAEFAYDTATGALTTEDGYTTTADETVLDEYTNVILAPAVAVPAIPARPAITEFASDKYGYYVKMDIPLADVDGNKIFGSLLSYQLMYELDGAREVFEFTTDEYLFLPEDMTAVPYNFTDSYDIDKAGRQVYLYSDEIDRWTAVGVKSIYTAGGETNESETFWLPLGQVAVGDIRAEKAVAGVRYYNLQGAEVPGDTGGVLICVTRYADGTQHAGKVIK